MVDSQKTRIMRMQCSAAAADAHTTPRHLNGTTESIASLSLRCRCQSSGCVISITSASASAPASASALGPRDIASTAAHGARRAERCFVQARRPARSVSVCLLVTGVCSAEVQRKSPSMHRSAASPLASFQEGYREITSCLMYLDILRFTEH